MIHVWPQELRRRNEAITLAATVETPAGRQDLWYEVPSTWESALIRQADPFAIATIFQGMRHGGRLHIHGTVSRSLLARLEEFQAVWSSWRPSCYRRAEITADSEAEAPVPQTDSAVASFSGGLDASFTVLRHVNKQCGRQTRHIGAGVLAHGFDIPCEESEAFAKAFARARETLADVQIPLIPVRTNYRVVETTVWTDTFAVAASACLMLFSARFRSGLFAGIRYATVAQHIPWGSNPVTDPMLSSAAFEFIPDAGGFSRVQKAEGLLQWPRALENLRVCWEGPMTGRNCGVCEKCIRTILDFRAAGGGLPPCFPSDVTDEQISKMSIRSRLEIADILEEIEARSLPKASWIHALEERLDRYDRESKPRLPIYRRILRKLGSIRFESGLRRCET